MTTNMTFYSLPDAICVNGCPATVGAAVRDPSLWVITLGGASAGTGWCASRKACAWEANSTFNDTARCPPAIPPRAPLNPGGLTVTDCGTQK